MKYIPKEVAATLIQSLVISRLDSMNALYYGLPDIELQKLQRIQNHAAKVILQKILTLSSVPRVNETIRVFFC